MKVERTFRQRSMERKRYDDAISNSPEEKIFEAEYLLAP
jgi:hypothetical protein